MRTPALALATLALSSCAAAAPADPAGLLTDADLAAYAARPPSATTGQRVVLGLHHGLMVIVEFPCGETCPAGATPIIHYEIGPGAPCAAAGGATVTHDLPYPGGEAEAQFCVPKVLAGR